MKSLGFKELCNPELFDVLFINSLIN